MEIDKKETILLIPVFNHGATLASVASRALEVGWQVLIVDDGSSDQGPAEAARLGVHLVTLPANQGKGAAIMAGAHAAWNLGYKAIITVDADGQHDPTEADRLLSASQEKWPAMVIGNRQMTGSTVPKASRFGRSFSNFWVHLETGKSLPDTQSGLRLYPLRELLQLPIKTRRFDFEIESLVRLMWAGVPVRSVDVSVYYPAREERISHFDMLWDNLRLSMLHTFLVLRALMPVPHKKLVRSAPKTKQPNPLLHPILFLKSLLGQHTSPLQIATAAWTGIFLGALPIIGFHTVAIIYVSHRLHLNKVAAVGASQLCMPPFVPLLCIQAGFFLRHGHFLTELSRETLLLQAAERFWEYFLGSLAVGPLLGLLVGLVSFFIATVLQKPQPVLKSCISGRR